MGFNPGPLSETDKRLVRAAARTHLATGLTIEAHTGPNVEAAKTQLALLAQEGVSPEAWIWVHANQVLSLPDLEDAAILGAWISLDGVSESSAERHIALVVALAEADLLARVLLSHDAGWYRVGEPDGGEYRPHTAAFTHVLPALRTRLGESAVTQILVGNPSRALARR